MAATSYSPTSHHQPRSKSLPSKPHPLILQCNQHLASLEDSDVNSSSSSPLFTNKLTGLQTLHDCVENLVLLPHCQQVLVQGNQEKWIDELLDGSLRLLDQQFAFCTTPHPTVSQFEENLQRLRGSEATSSASSSSSLCNKLNDMQDMHDCIDNLLQLPIEQQALAQECNEKLVEDLLEGSLRILDICSEAKDCLFLSKESMHELQSVIRRRRGNETGFTVEGVKYLTLRKNMKKQIQKVLRNLKAMKNELIASSSNNANNTSAMFGFLKEAEAVTLGSLEHVLLFISDPKRHSKQSRWSAISKLMQPQRPICDSQNEFEKVDADLQSLISHKPVDPHGLHCIVLVDANFLPTSS